MKVRSISNNTIVFERTPPDAIFNKIIVEAMKEKGAHLSVSKDKMILKIKS